MVAAMFSAAREKAGLSKGGGYAEKRGKKTGSATDGKEAA